MPYGRFKGCAAFHPMDDNILYVFGGYSYGYPTAVLLDHAFRIFINDSNASATDLKPMDDKKSTHSCIGYMNRDGLPAILIVGGALSGGVDVKSVIEYDITSNTYSERPPLDKAAKAPVLVIKDGFLYAFGGAPDRDRQISRIHLSFTQAWEDVGILQDPYVYGWSYVLQVFPYN